MVNQGTKRLNEHAAPCHFKGTWDRSADTGMGDVTGWMLRFELSCVRVKWWLRLGLHVCALEIPRKPPQDVPAWSVVVSTTLACQAGYDLVSRSVYGRFVFLGRCWLLSAYTIVVQLLFPLGTSFKTWTYSDISNYLQIASNCMF